MGLRVVTANGDGPLICRACRIVPKKVLKPPQAAVLCLHLFFEFQMRLACERLESEMAPMHKITAAQYRSLPIRDASPS